MSGNEVTAVMNVYRIVEGTNISHLDKVERGYENMSHFTAHLERERRALQTIDFLKREETRCPVISHSHTCRHVISDVSMTLFVSY